MGKHRTHWLCVNLKKRRIKTNKVSVSQILGITSRGLFPEKCTRRMTASWLSSLLDEDIVNWTGLLAERPVWSSELSLKFLSHIRILAILWRRKAYIYFGLFEKQIHFLLFFPCTQNQMCAAATQWPQTQHSSNQPTEASAIIVVPTHSKAASPILLPHPPHRWGSHQQQPQPLRPQPMVYLSLQQLCSDLSKPKPTQASETTTPVLEPAAPIRTEQI